MMRCKCPNETKAKTYTVQGYQVSAGLRPASSAAQESSKGVMHTGTDGAAGARQAGDWPGRNAHGHADTAAAALVHRGACGMLLMCVAAALPRCAPAHDSLARMLFCATKQISPSGTSTSAARKKKPPVSSKPARCSAHAARAALLSNRQGLRRQLHRTHSGKSILVNN